MADNAGKNLTPLYVGEKHLSLACEHALQGTLVAGLWSIRVQTIENCCRFVFYHRIDSFGVHLR